MTTEVSKLSRIVILSPEMRVSKLSRIVILRDETPPEGIRRRLVVNVNYIGEED